MKVRVVNDAKGNYIRRMTITCHSAYNHEFADMLDKISGQVIEVETDYLFSDQFNTVPIPGVSELGMRLMNRDIAEVIDDIRPEKMRCRWCGKTSDLGDTCPKCGKTEYLERFKDIYLWKGIKKEKV